MFKVVTMLAGICFGSFAQASSAEIAMQMGGLIRSDEIQDAIYTIVKEHTKKDGDEYLSVVHFRSVEFESQAKCKGDLRQYSLIFHKYVKGGDIPMICRLPASAGRCGSAGPVTISYREPAINAAPSVNDDDSYVFECEAQKD